MIDSFNTVYINDYPGRLGTENGCYRRRVRVYFSWLIKYVWIFMIVIHLKKLVKSTNWWALNHFQNELV